MKRSPLGRGKPLSRGKPLERATPQIRGRSALGRGKRLAARSEKRIDEDEEWRDVKMFVTARDGGHCQAERLVPEVACGGRLHVHHVATRARYPALWLDPEICLLLCARHHEFAHGNPTAAVELGLLWPSCS